MADKLSNTDKSPKAESLASYVGAGDSAGSGAAVSEISPDDLPPKLAPMELAVFPLPLFILPGGIQRLRIFEPRYLTMIAEALSSTALGETQDSPQGFVIALYDKGQHYHVPNWGTRVQVIDFHNGDDGILVIDVKATGLVNLSEFRYRTDRLLLAKAEPREHWPAAPCFDGGGALGERLTQFIEKHPLLAEHYSQRDFNDMSWICGRFLELLPLSLNDKEKFVTPTMLEPLKAFLHTFILGESQASH